MHSLVLGLTSRRGFCTVARVQVLLRSAFHLSRMRDGGDVRVAFAVDAATGLRADDVVRLLEPWRAWVEVVDLHVGATPPPEEWLAVAAANGAAAVAPVSESSDFVATVAGRAAAHGAKVVRCGYETDSPRDAAFLHEMCHHHYEMGGVNEWDGAPAMYSTEALQVLSTANCVRHFPRYLTDALRARRVALGRPLEALDVGSGPGSRLRWGVLQDLLRVTAVDPLLDVYEIVLAHHGLDRLPGILPARAIVAPAEELDQHVPPAAFDLAFCANALDHVEDPPAVVEQIARSVRPGGLFAMRVSTREGSRQSWQQLHQFDLFLDPAAGELKCQSRDGTVVPLVPERTGLTIERVLLADEEHTIVVLAA